MRTLFRLFLQGYLATVASFGPFSALYFMFYEQARAASRNLFGEEAASAQQQAVRGEVSRCSITVQCRGANGNADW